MWAFTSQVTSHNFLDGFSCRNAARSSAIRHEPRIYDGSLNREIIKWMRSPRFENRLLVWRSLGYSHCSLKKTCLHYIADLSATCGAECGRACMHACMHHIGTRLDTWGGGRWGHRVTNVTNVLGIRDYQAHQCYLSRDVVRAILHFP
jgi:hypothetical protein